MNFSFYFVRSKKFKIIYFLLIVLFLQNETNAQLETHNFEFEGSTRRYKVFLPQNFEPNMPVVFVLHGYLQNTRDIISYTGMSDVADTAGFIAVYPEAVYPGWNTGLVHEGLPPLDTTANDVGFISVLIDTLVSQYDIDYDRIYCCGFSLGGQMSFMLACELGHSFAAVASVAGPVNHVFAPGCELIHPIPALYMHGTADSIVFYQGDIKTNHFSVEETVNFWVEQNKCLLPADKVALPDYVPNDGCLVEKNSYLDNSESISFIFFKVIGGGHSWPGTPEDKDWGKPRNLDIHASSLIWNFLKNYELVTSFETINNEYPITFILNQNYPNPFNPETTIGYQITKSSYVDLSIYNILGEKVTTLVSEEQPSGIYKVEWDASGFASSVYYYLITAGDPSASLSGHQIGSGQVFQQAKKMVLLK